MGGRRVLRGIGAALVAAGLCLAWPGAAGAQLLSPLPPQPAGTPWPTQAWSEGPVPAAVDPRALAEVLGEAFPGPHPRFGETRALIVVQGGRIVLERYGAGFGPATRHVSWSMAKSLTHALVGVAVAEGRVDIDRPMGNRRWAQTDPRAAIPWRSWLQMVDGQEHREIGAGSAAQNDAARSLFGSGRADVAGYAAGLPLVHPPGARWNYSTSGVMLIADALGERIAPAAAPEARRRAMAAWMRRGLFGPIGMTSAQPEFDAQGLFLGGSLVYATARDYARFGLLYLRDGIWEGRRILPPGWVDFARTPAPGSGQDVYGAGFWLTPVRGTGTPMRALIADRDPFDAFSAQGHQGQVILIVPSRDLVIVRLGAFGAGGGDWDRLGDWISRLARLFPPPSPARGQAT